MIKDRQWLDELHNTLKARGTPQQRLAERYNNELVIVYAQDDPNRMRYLTIQEDFGLSREALRALAIDNLKRLLPKIEILVYDEIMLVSAGGDYEASLLLIDEIWTGGQIKVDGDIVVAIPARDTLLVTGSRNRAGLKRMRELTAKAMAQGPYELTDTLVPLSRRPLHQVRLAMIAAAHLLVAPREPQSAALVANAAIAANPESLPLTRARIRTSARTAWHRPAIPAD